MGNVGESGESSAGSLFSLLQLTYAGLGTFALVLGLGVRRRHPLVRLPTVAFLGLMGAYWLSTVTRVVLNIIATPKLLDAATAVGGLLLAALAVWTVASIQHLLKTETKREFTDS